MNCIICWKGLLWKFNGNVLGCCQTIGKWTLSLETSSFCIWNGQPHVVQKNGWMVYDMDSIFSSLTSLFVWNLLRMCFVSFVRCFLCLHFVLQLWKLFPIIPFY